jgi:hypothetical protein
VVAGARGAWRRHGARRRAGFQLGPARSGNSDGCPALRRLRHSRGQRRDFAGKPGAAAARLSSR